MTTYQVLIVDDEKLMRDALSVMVSKVNGFRVAASVGSAKEAIDIFSGEKIHIVFMDIKMPGISGIDASRTIYAMDNSVAICIVSAVRNFEAAKEALSARVYDYIQKPVSFSIIDNLLSGYRDSMRRGDSHIASLVGLLENREYGKISALTAQIAQKVSKEESKNNGKLRERFFEIGKRVMDSVDHTSCDETDTLEFFGQFPINDVFGRESLSWSFWLANVMDAAFRRRASIKYEHLQNVFEYMDKNIKSAINLCNVCEACAISQSYLSKLFKAQFGVSVMEYIHLRKLNHAKMYFAFSELNMTDVSFRVGYNEGSYFSKVFKKFEGVTPQAYKNSIVSQRSDRGSDS